MDADSDEEPPPELPPLDLDLVNAMVAQVRPDSGTSSAAANPRMQTRSAARATATGTGPGPSVRLHNVLTEDLGDIRIADPASEENDDEADFDEDTSPLSKVAKQLTLPSAARKHPLRIQLKSVGKSKKPAAPKSKNATQTATSSKRKTAPDGETPSKKRPLTVRQSSRKI